MMNNKRGELTDIMVWVISVFILAVGLFILAFITPQILNGLKASEIGTNTSSPSYIAIDDAVSTMSGVINNGFLMLFVGLCISMFVTSFMVRTHPIFLFLYILFTVVTLIIGLYLGNAYYDLQTNPLFVDYMDETSFINTIMNNIVEITLVVSALSMIIMFSKFNSGGSPTAI